LAFEIPSRPRRRLFRYLIPLLVAALVVLGIVVTAAGAETRAQIEYLTRLGDAADRIADGDVAFGDAVARLSTISRVEFTTAVDRVTSDLDEAVAILEEEPPNKAVFPVRALYREAVVAWRQGVTLLSESLLSAADDPSSGGPIDQVVLGLSMLRVGDSVWAQLLEELEGDDVPSPVRPFPAITMSPSEGNALALALQWLQAAQSESNSLGLRPGIMVASVVADPEWQIDAADQVVVPVTDRVTFSVVVGNAGNIDTLEAVLRLTVVGGPEPVEQEMTVDPLEPGRQVTLVFDPVDVEPGAVYQVRAWLIADFPDADATDNEIVVQFRVGED